MKSFVQRIVGIAILVLGCFLCDHLSVPIILPGILGFIGALLIFDA
jgi:hypothetical protein